MWHISYIFQKKVAFKGRFNSGRVFTMTKLKNYSRKSIDIEMKCFVTFWIVVLKSLKMSHTIWRLCSKCGMNSTICKT